MSPARPKAPLLAFVLLALLPAFASAQSRPLSGIPELDSLPVHDWGVPAEPVSLPLTAGLSLVFPGGGQFYSGHPVRGSFLLGLEAMLLGVSLYAFQSDLPRRDREIRRNLDSADAAAIRLAQGDASASAALENWTLRARRNAGLRLQYADLANSQMAWALGLHAYGVADAVEIALRSRNPEPRPRSPGRAFLYGIAIPGGAQIYNGRYGKLGMLWMALGASAVSAWSRQNVVESLNGSLAVARAEGDLFEAERLEEERTLFRRRRNQYFWGMALIHVYAVMDGMVDASMADFDSPKRYAFGPGSQPFSLVGTVRF